MANSVLAQECVARRAAGRSVLPGPSADYLLICPEGSHLVGGAGAVEECLKGEVEDDPQLAAPLRGLVVDWGREAVHNIQPLVRLRPTRCCKPSAGAPPITAFTERIGR